LRDPEPLPRLYLITDRHATPGARLVEAVERALEGGVRLVQLREKDLAVGELRALASRLRDATRAHDARLLLNAGDDPRRIEVAAAVGADGIHLTSTGGLSVADVRASLGATALVGVSTHSLGEVERAARAGASFVTFGPVYETPSKRDMGEPTGVAQLADAAALAAPMPVYGLGGIGLEAIDAVRASGAHGVGLIRAVLAAADPTEASRAIFTRLGASR
jgi:thiamine-phosphate pyrophosphorylase